MYACLHIGMNVCPIAAWIVNAIIYGVLTAIGLLGVAVLMFIRSTPSKPKHEKMVSGARIFSPPNCSKGDTQKEGMLRVFLCVCLLMFVQPLLGGAKSASKLVNASVNSER